jgi:hypothetical protein
MGKHHGDHLHRDVRGGEIGREIVMLVESGERVVADVAGDFDIGRVGAADGK